MIHDYQKPPQDTPRMTHIVGHEHQHEETRQQHGSAVQDGTQHPKVHWERHAAYPPNVSVGRIRVHGAAHPTRRAFLPLSNPMSSPRSGVLRPLTMGLAALFPLPTRSLILASTSR